MDAGRGGRYNSAVTTSSDTTYPGLYDAGRGEGPRDAVVRATLTRLEIRDLRGLLLSVWPYADVRPLPAEDVTKALRVGCRTKPEASLAVLDPSFAGTLRERLSTLPKRADPAPARVKAPRRRVNARGGMAAAGLVALGLALYGVAAVAAPRVAAHLADRLPTVWSVTWGAGLSAAAGARCEEAAGREALEALAGRLQAAAGLNYAISVTVVDDAVVQARALPGGEILVTRGLIELLRTPDELAGVLAHEVAATRDWGPERAILANLSLPDLVGLYRSGAQADATGLRDALAGARPSAAEQAALDAATLALLTEAGLRSRGLAAFHDVLASKAAQDGRTPLYSRTHATDRARTERLRGGPAGGAQALTYAQWEAVKSLCTRAFATSGASDGG